MSSLAIESLPAVPHVVFGIFNLSIPNIIFWAVVIISFFLGCWARIPSFMEHGRAKDADGTGSSHES
jgi:hypothetical protein